MEGNDSRAAEHFANSAELDPSGLAALQGLANAMASAQRYEGSVEVYRRIVELSPSDPVARFNLAVALSRVRRFDEAEALYLQLLAENDSFAQARYNLASLYQVQGKLKRAVEVWRKVVAQAPHLPSAHAALGEALMDLNRPKEAMAAYAEAAKLAPNDAGFWLNLSVAARSAGSVGRAIVAASRASQLVGDAATWRFLGQQWLELHRVTDKEEFLTRAVEAWRESLLLDPNQPDLRKMLETYGTPTSSPATNPAKPVP
jgi:tetratricopeptide (TPR) repeat protein